DKRVRKGKTVLETFRSSFPDAQGSVIEKMLFADNSSKPDIDSYKQGLSIWREAINDKQSLFKKMTDQGPSDRIKKEYKEILSAQDHYKATVVEQIKNYYKLYKEEKGFMQDENNQIEIKKYKEKIEKKNQR